ncbi:MAG TPA: CHAP domain-containing protein [Marmoricola sp.]|nr:CHAP domain-containing protein [Marmoricola sp.]
MRIWRRTYRRVILTWQSAVLVVLAGCLAVGAALVVPNTATATPLVDDYPAYLKAKPLDALVDPWYFYSRECTSFVAWRLTHDNGIPFTNNWAGAHFGNAYQWAAAAQKLGFAVNGTPSVGSVAWWSAHSAGSWTGHVAWVARVYADRSILIEEYNYVSPGNYSQRHLYPSSSLWPSGFLHLRDLTMANTAPPKIPGTPTVGATITASPGTWKPAGSVSFTYAWYANGVQIPGIKTQTYTPTPDTLGKTLTVKVTASMGTAKPKTVSSLVSAAVVAGTLVASGTPVVVGTAQVGVPLVANSSWKQPANLAYQWYSNGIAIPDATNQTYVPTPGDLGATISVAVTATATGYKVAKASMASGTKVAPGVFKQTKVPTITGTPTVGTPLAASTGTWSPSANNTYTYQWYTGTTAIPGATAAIYTPTPTMLAKTLSVRVTAAAAGYTPMMKASAITKAVIPGVFKAAALSALPTPAVGAPLTAQPGTITGTTTPKVTYQWNLAGKAIKGATSQTYTPLPSELNKQLSVTVTASSSGYTTLIRTTPLSKAVQLGTLSIKTQPSISGAPKYGQSTRYTQAGWSAAPSSVKYQWYANGKPIKGATQPTYTPSTSVVGQKLSMVESVTSPGYHNASVTTTASEIVMGGTATLSSRPVISGSNLVGSTLMASAGTAFPSDAQRSIQWLRDGVAIPKATAWAYRLTTADIGHRFSVRVTVSRSLWTSSDSNSSSTDAVRSPATMVSRLTRIKGGKVHVVVTITAPGVSALSGRIDVRAGGKLLGSGRVVNGRATFDVSISSGISRLNLVYAGDRRVQSATQRNVQIH